MAGQLAPARIERLRDERAIAAAPAAAPEHGATPASDVARAGVSGTNGPVVGLDSSLAPGSASALSASEIARLDAVMRPEAVFPDAAQRSAYRAEPPVVKDGKRSYTFELSPQPGMVQGQHFHSITFAFAPARTQRPSRHGSAACHSPSSLQLSTVVPSSLQREVPSSQGPPHLMSGR